MVIKPKSRWVFPINFREQDQQILETLTRIAREEETTLTDIVRTALKEFTACRARGNGITKMDLFLENDADFKIRNNPTYQEILTPDRLHRWQNEELLRFSRAVRSRKFELEAELRLRGFWFRW